MSKPISRRYWMAAGLCAAVAITALSLYLQWTDETTHRFLMLFLAAVLTALGAPFLACAKPRLRGYGLAMGACFALAQVCGERLTTVGTLAQAGHAGTDFLLLALCTVGLAPAGGALFALFVRAIEKQRSLPKPERKLSQRKVFWGSALILMLCWLPVFLAFYPGLFTYDISYQYLQYTTGAFNTHHPLLHTLLVGGFCDLGRALTGFPVKGLAAYTLFQMGVAALVMAYAVAYLYRRGMRLGLCVALLAMFGFLPFHSLLAVSTTKDTLFAASVLYLCVLLYQCKCEPELMRSRGWMVRFVLAAAAVGLLRNNGFICILGVLLAAVAASIRRRPESRRLMALSLSGLLLLAACGQGLKLAVHAEGSPRGEAFSVPIQMLSRVYALTDDEDKAEILRWLPDVVNYAPTISDPVKGTFEAESAELPAFFGLWARVGLRHPVIYLDALGLLTKEYYQLDGLIPRGAKYLETKFHESKEDMMLEHSLLPQLRQSMATLYSDNAYLKIPIYSTILSHAFWCWFFLLTLAGAMYLRDRAALLPCWALLLLFLTILMGPCVMLRYIYPLMTCGPVLMSMLTIPPKAQTA